MQWVGVLGGSALAMWLSVSDFSGLHSGDTARDGIVRCGYISLDGTDMLSGPSILFAL